MTPVRHSESLEAQQRYFSCHAILVAIVSPNSFVLVFLGYRTISRDMLQNGVSQRCACVKLSTNRGYHTSLGSANRANIYTPPPSTPENTLLGVGGACKRGGGLKFLPLGGFKIFIPPASPLKMTSGKNRGDGGRGHIKFLTRLDWSIRTTAMIVSQCPAIWGH